MMRIALLFVVALAGVIVSAQPLLELSPEKVEMTSLQKLYASRQAKPKASGVNSSTCMTKTVEAKKLIVVNPMTLDNVVLSLADDMGGTIKVTPLLIAELRNAGLDHAEVYDCIVADVTASGEYDCQSLSSVDVPNEIKLPQFRYGRKGNVRLAAQAERKIKSVELNVPVPIFGSEVSEDEYRLAFEKNRQMALDNGWYSYEYVLPNGDLTTYADFGDLEPSPDLSDADAISEDNGQNAGIVISDWTGKVSSYNVEPLTAAAKTSMSAGAERWNDVLTMKVSVIAKVGFTGDYGSGSSTLGSSWSPPTYTQDGIAYPAALIDQILGQDMHPSQDYDIRIIYNKDYSFYYGTDGNCPSTQHDFQSIVTHELCHGLGFTSYHYRGANSSAPDGSWSTSNPSIFDMFLYYDTERLPNLSQATRKIAFTSNALYWDGENAKTANGGSRIKMYAPTTYKSGSSVSHWDDSVTFETFMKRATSKGVVHHDIDSRLIGAFKDMGWKLKDDIPPAPTFPVNDNFANATAISGTSGSLTVSSVNATKESGEPYHGTSSATNSVWWKWTATSTGSMTITTEGSGFDTGLGVYTGSSVSALTKIADNDDNGAGGTWSSVTFTAVAGTTYYIAVAGYQGKTGSIKLNWQLTVSTTYFISYALNGGTHGTTHPTSATYNSAFYVSAPTRSGYTFTGWTVTSGLNTSTAKWGTTSSPSTAISSSTAKCFNGTTGNVYFKNLTVVGGSVTLTANWSAAPANDNFANATVISGQSGSTTGSNVGATSQSGEPLIAYRSSATTTVWWKWTAPLSGNVQIDTTGSSFDTVLGVYTGSSVTALQKAATLGAEDDDSGGNSTSKCAFGCVGGTTYYICVAGYGGATGTVKLQWSLTLALPDLCFTYKNTGWPQSVFLSDSPANSNAVTRFAQGSPIYLFCRFSNDGTADVPAGFDILHEVLDANGNCVASSMSEIDYAVLPGYGRFWSGSRFTFLQGLEPGAYTYRCTADSRGLVNESNESNNVRTYAFTVTADVEPPANPSISVTTYGTSSANTSYISVVWSGGSGATSFNLYRSTSTTRPSLPFATNVTSPYKDYKSTSGLTPGVRYYYWVAAVNSAGTAYSSSDWGNILVSLSLGKTTDSSSASGGSGSASVTANTSWSASANVSWITFGTKSGNSNGTLTYTVAANTTTSSRTGTITVTAGSGTAYPMTKTITVIQAAAVSQPIPLLPSNPTSKDVYDALSGSADARLQVRITEPTEYNAYREWALSVKAPGGLAAAGAQTVKNSPNAWLSYALDSETLIQTVPVDGDLKVDKFEPSPKVGLFNFTVSVDDIQVGYDAKPSNLATVFGIEGGSTLGGMSADKVVITFGTPENGKVKFTAGPKDKAQPVFFMKVKMTP